MSERAEKTPQAARPQRKVPELLERYRKEIAPALSRQFKRTNLLAVPRLDKIVVNVGCGEAAHEAKLLEAVQRDVALITGQRPLTTRAKKAVSNFKIRLGDPVGCKVTLRRDRMYEFFERLVMTALPRIRDFRGLSQKGFDQRGNYAFGVTDHTIFPEIQVDKVEHPFGMDIVIGTTAGRPEEGLALLKGFGFPFAADPSGGDGKNLVA